MARIGATVYLKDKKLSLLTQKGVSDEDDTSGLKYEVAEDGGNLWAYYRHASMAERESLDIALDKEVNSVFRINWRDDITTDWRILYEGKEYEIVEIDNHEGYKNDLKIYAKTYEGESGDKREELNLIVEIDDDKNAALSWNEVKNGELTSEIYEVYRDEKDGDEFKEPIHLNREMDTLRETSFTDETAESGKTYRYWVVAYAGNRYFVNQSEKIEITIEAGNEEESLFTFIDAQETEDGEGVTINWGIENVEDLEEFMIYRATKEGDDFGSYERIASIDEKETEYIDDDINGGETYKYKIEAYNGLKNKIDEIESDPVETTEVEEETQQLETPEIVGEGQDMFGELYAVIIDWGLIDNADTYKVYKDGEKIGEADGDRDFYRNEDDPAGEYYIIAHDSSGEYEDSEKSNTVTIEE